MVEVAAGLNNQEWKALAGTVACPHLIWQGLASVDKYTCPCCGYKTLDEPPPGSFDICPICYWEDDNLQFVDPDYAGGANRVSLRQAQETFAAFGASDRDYIEAVRRPNATDEKDHHWKALPQHPP